MVTFQSPMTSEKYGFSKITYNAEHLIFNNIRFTHIISNNYTHQWSK